MTHSRDDPVSKSADIIMVKGGVMGSSIERWKNYCI